MSNADWLLLLSCIILVATVLLMKDRGRSLEHAAIEPTIAGSFEELLRLSRRPGDLEGQPTMFLLLTPTCRFCLDSLPFYSRLSNARIEASAMNLRAVVPRPELIELQSLLLAHAGVIVDTIVAYDTASDGITGVPSILVVDQAGSVMRYWRGQLDDAYQDSVLNVVRGRESDVQH